MSVYTHKPNDTDFSSVRLSSFAYRVCETLLHKTRHQGQGTVLCLTTKDTFWPTVIAGDETITAYGVRYSKRVPDMVHIISNSTSALLFAVAYVGDKLKITWASPEAMAAVKL